MAGWTKLKDNLCVNECNETLEGSKNELRRCFLELVSRFINGSSQSSGCFRPLPPRLGTGHCVDLLRLYCVVKKFGGFEAISSKDLWGEVGLQCGFESSFGCAFKLIYTKYLRSLEGWAVNLDQEKEVLMEVDRNYSAFVSRFMDCKRSSHGSSSLEGERSDVSFVDLTEDGYESDLDWKKVVTDFADSEGSNEGSEEPVKPKQPSLNMGFGRDSAVKSKQSKAEMSFADAMDSYEVKCESVNSKEMKVEVNSASNEVLIEDNHNPENLKQAKSESSFIEVVSSDVSDNRRFSVSPIVADDVVKSSENSVASKKCSTKDEEDEMTNVNSGLCKEVSSHKRKRHYLSGMLQWMATVAKDPTDPVLGEIPEPRKWASYGNDKCWRQALIARETLFLKKIRNSSIDQSGSQKKQKMHPSLFEASSVSTESYQGRPKQRLEARLDMQPTSSIYTCRPQQRIPVGKAFQAELPQWTGVAVESDSKWLGTQIWPVQKKNTALVERDPIGKGRANNCGCQFPGSAECVKFHIRERRVKVRDELGSAFAAWNFHRMGENYTISWTDDEQKKFERVVKENPQSMLKCFWLCMHKALPHKSWEDLVNYYFNVFILRRRAYQNRHCSPRDIDSDDDETEYRATSNSMKHGAK